MPADIPLAALLGGLATYLIRLLPMLADKVLPRLLPCWARGLLLAMGPAALAALLILSLADQVQSPTALAVPAGLAGVFVVHRLTANVALATVAGALAFGLTAAIFTA